MEQQNIRYMQGDWLGGDPGAPMGHVEAKEKEEDVGRNVEKKKKK